MLKKPASPKTVSFINVEVVGGKMFNMPSKDKIRQNNRYLLINKVLRRVFYVIEAKTGYYWI